MKKLTSILLALCILLCGLPFCASAAEASAGTVTFTAVDGTENTSNPQQNYPKLIDGDKNSKWCYSIENELYIVMKASKSVAVNGYTFTTGNDNASASNNTAKGRNPKDWELYGCNDYNEADKTGSWAALHSVANDTTMQDKDLTDYSFSFNNAIEYKYYKLVIKSSRGNSMMQLSEMKFNFTENGWYTPSGGKAISLGTAAILNPVSDGHQWQRIYFGTYNNNPIDFRILSKSTTEFSEGTNTPTMLLEYSDILFTKQVDSVVWSESSIRSDLNGDFLTKSFTSQEQSAINASKKSQSTTDAHLSVALTGEKIFILDFQEYSTLKYGFKANAYVGKSALTRTRYASQNDNGEYVYGGTLRLTGLFKGNFQNALVDKNAGISPALNIKLSSVLFTKNVSGDVSAYYTATNPAYYKLSLVNTALTAAVNGNAVKTGNTVSIPYKVTGNDATQLSVMILNKPYTEGNTNGAVMKYYAKLATVTSQKTGTASLTVPTEFSAKVPCKDYYIYLVAEDINDEKATDYASKPVLVTPKYTVTYKPGTNGTGSSKTVYKTTGTAL